MTLDLILHHNLDPDWLVSRSIDVLISLYERHIESLGMMMPFGMQAGLTGQTGVTTNSDLYETKTWKEGKTVYNRINLLEGGLESKGIKVKEGLISSKNKK